MVHVNSALLAGHALGQDDALDDADREHLAGCDHCRAELDQYRRVVALSQEAEPAETPIAPLDRIWQSIQAELSPNSGAERTATKTAVPDSVPTPVAAAQAAGEERASEEVTAAGRDESPVGRRRKWWPIAAAAAALGLVVGAGATVIINRNDVQVAASTPLTALPGHTGQGNAELISARNDPQLRVSVDGPSPADSYREVWLINSDGKRMYSLGVLPEGGSGTYPLPTLLANGLDGFTIVDVSIEPYDGNPEHSHNSQVRGTLPE